jgi:hypothetical protein
LAEAHQGRKEKEHAHCRCGFQCSFALAIVDPDHGSRLSSSVRFGQKKSFLFAIRWLGVLKLSALCRAGTLRLPLLRFVDDEFP